MMVFLIGAGIIAHLFSIPLVDVRELSTDRPVYDGETVAVLGQISPSDFPLDEKISFEEEVSVHSLEKEGYNVLVAYPGEAEGFVFVRGRYIIPDTASEAPGFIYASKIRSAWPIEELGISKEGIVIVVFYLLASLTAFFYEFRKSRMAAELDF